MLPGFGDGLAATATRSLSLKPALGPEARIRKD